MSKKNRTITYRNPPKDGRVICFDEFVLEVRPQLGENWGAKADRIPATYTRKQGVRNLLSALDLKNKIYGHLVNSVDKLVSSAD